MARKSASPLGVINSSHRTRRFLALLFCALLTSSAPVTAEALVSAPAGSPLVVDTFERTLVTGWGSADTGGTWTGSTASLSVAGGNGQIRVAAPGNAPSVYLPATTTGDADLTVTIGQGRHRQRCLPVHRGPAGCRGRGLPAPDSAAC